MDEIVQEKVPQGGGGACLKPPIGAMERTHEMNELRVGLYGFHLNGLHPKNPDSFAKS